MSQMNFFEKKRQDLIKSYEGYDPNAYQLDGENFYTIGYGSTEDEYGRPFQRTDTVSENRAQELLSHHIARARSKVSKEPGYKKLPINAQIAVDSFAYNTGPNFIDDDDGYGTINRAIRAGNPEGIAEALPLYNNGGLAGLVRRRDEEATLALTPAFDRIDSTLRNDLSRAFGTEAVLKGSPVKWGGKDYGWQSPEGFNSIVPN